MKRASSSQLLLWSETGGLVGVSVASPQGDSLDGLHLMFALDPSERCQRG